MPESTLRPLPQAPPHLTIQTPDAKPAHPNQQIQSDRSKPAHPYRQLQTGAHNRMLLVDVLTTKSRFPDTIATTTAAVNRAPPVSCAISGNTVQRAHPKDFRIAPRVASPSTPFTPRPDTPVVDARALTVYSTTAHAFSFQTCATCVYFRAGQDFWPPAKGAV